MSERLHLEDAFGERFRPRPDDTADAYGYTPAELEPGECTPAPGSAAARTFDGAALVFDAARIQLDL